MPALSTLAHGVRFELKAMLRNPRARFFTLIFPVVMLVVLCGVAGNGTTTQGGEVIKLARFYVPAILALAIVTSCFGALTQSIVTRRHLGVFKRRRTAPVPAWSLVLGQSLANTAVALTTVVVLLIAGKAIYGIGLATPGLVAVALTIVLGAICFCAVAFAVSSVIPSPDAAQPIVQALLLPLYFISGIWLPMDSLPSGVQAVGNAFPVAHLASALHRAFAHDTLAGAISMRDLAVLAAWTVGAGIVAIRRFSWLPARATA